MTRYPSFTHTICLASGTDAEQEINLDVETTVDGEEVTIDQLHDSDTGEAFDWNTLSDRDVDRIDERAIELSREW